MHQDVSGGSIYVGTGGVALTYLHIAQQVQRGFRYPTSSYLQKHTKRHALNLAKHFVKDAESVQSAKRVSFLEGYSGIMAMQAVVCHHTGDAEGEESSVKVRNWHACCRSSVAHVCTTSMKWQQECRIVHVRSRPCISLASSRKSDPSLFVTDARWWYGALAGAMCCDVGRRLKIYTPEVSQTCHGESVSCCMAEQGICTHCCGCRSTHKNVTPPMTSSG